ncbi:MAG: hypothetical protein NTW33_00940 [Methanoregula sp.]|nr:hypothetical protein [Methanoregula sp.]
MNERLHDLSALFRTKERIKLLRTTLSLPVCTVQQVTIRTGLSKGLVSQYLALLEHEGLLERINRKYQLKMCPLTSAVKRLLNVDPGFNRIQKTVMVAWCWNIWELG